MGRTYAHVATLHMRTDEDDRAPGAAITVGLCGSWEHDGTCPLAPHSVDAVRDGTTVRVRVVFVTEAQLEQSVRDRIVRSLELGDLSTPDGGRANWQYVEGGVDEVTDVDRAHAERFAQAGPAR